jgi:D-3-phosphoglycerate dehydrogenase
MKTYTTGRVLVTAYPFGEIDRDPIQLLETQKIPFALNHTSRRLREEELAGLIGPYEALIAGTEPITDSARERSDLRLIARVGIGLDSVDLDARRREIQVVHSFGSVSAVAELTVGQMISLLRELSPSIAKYEAESGTVALGAGWGS